MKLVQYLNEVETIMLPFDEYSFFTDHVKKKCKQVVRDLKKGKIIFVRGFLMGVPDSFRKKTQKFRKPKDTFVEQSEYADDWFQAKFGWRARSGNVVFAWIKRHDSDEPWTYPTRRAIYPIGKVKYVWSPNITDMTLRGDRVFRQARATKEDVWNWLDKQSYTDKAPTSAAAGVEIMIQCKEYYATSKEKHIKELQK